MDKITVFVPAHNEEVIIEDTLKSIVNQSLTPYKIIVIADNCSDRTIELANSFSKQNVEVFETKQNKNKKAGALNQAFDYYDLQGFVFIMDADTVLHKDALKEGYKVMQRDKLMGAVCSRAGILPYNGSLLREKIIHSLQHIEYGQFDADRVETMNRIKVSHGMASLFRVSALEDAINWRKENLNINTSVFLEDSLVEDYELTLCLKHNWRVTSSLNMLAWTDVPLSWSELWTQRLRWLRGGVDTLRVHGFNSVTSLEIFNHIFGVVMIVIRLYAYAFTWVSLYHIGFQGFNKVILFLISFALIDSFYRMKYIQGITKIDVILKLLIFPEILYGWFQAINLLYSYYLSFFNVEQNWVPIERRKTNV